MNVLATGFMVCVVCKDFHVVVCIRFASVGKTSQESFLQLGLLFSEHEAAKLGLEVKGIFCGSVKAVVVNLNGALKQFTKSHFKSKCLSSAKTTAKIKGRSLWYGIKDGNNRHLVIVSLIKPDERGRQLH